jgi:glyoxylase-like metal-dependent hydrolase (beta-lactamase superfamily II)
MHVNAYSEDDHAMTDRAEIRAFFDEPTNTVSYLVWDPATKQGAVVDPVLDWDNRSGEADTAFADRILAAAAAEGVTIALVLETHAHADHLTAAPYIKARTGAPIGIGEHIVDVQRIFRPVFDARDVKPAGGDFDRLFKDGERVPLGALTIEVMHVPGHTPADIAYRIGDDVFVGDTLFMHDYGTARADFPGGDARQLFRSIRRLLALPAHTRLWMCHDYKAPGRDHYAWQSTVAEQRAHNPHVKDGTTEEAFVAFRTARDATLAAPLLLLPSIQVNIRAGRFPDAEENGVRYLRVPVRPKKPEAVA